MHLPSRLLITCIHQEGSVLGAEPLTLLPRLSDSFLSFFLSRSCCCCGYSSKSPQICSQLRAEETACPTALPPKTPIPACAPGLLQPPNHQRVSLPVSWPRSTLLSRAALPHSPGETKRRPRAAAAPWLRDGEHRERSAAASRRKPAHQPPPQTGAIG